MSVGGGTRWFDPESEGLPPIDRPVGGRVVASTGWLGALMALAGAVLVLAGVCLWWALALKLSWNWLLAPSTGLPALSLAAAAGVPLLVAVARGLWVEPRPTLRLERAQIVAGLARLASPGIIILVALLVRVAT